MRFGLTLPNFGYGAQASRQHILEVALAAEQAGYLSLWASDHILVGSQFPRYGHLYESLVTLAWVAAKTERIRVGTSILVVPMRNAILAAKQVATLDDLAAGRFILGVGVGWNEEEYGFVGGDWRRRGALLDESIRVMRNLWTNENPSFAGEFYRYDNAMFSPRPAQAGGPPIWVGGNSEAALRRAARLGDGWHADDLRPDDFAAKVAKLRQYAADEGRNVSPSIRLTVDMFAALEKTRGNKTIPGAPMADSPDIGIGGDFSKITDMARRYREMGATDFICQFEHESVSQHVEFLRAFAQEVVAHV